MTSTLQLLKSEKFGEIQADIYNDTESSEMFMTAKQLSECLDYVSKTAFDSLISRNPYIKESEFSATCKLQVPQGNRTTTQKTRLFNEDGIYEVTFLSKTDKAIEFRRWVRGILKSLRKGELQLSSSNISLHPQVIDAKIQQLLGVITDQSNDLNFIKQQVFQLSSSLSYFAKEHRDKANVWKKKINTRILEINKVSGISNSKILNQIFYKMKENGCDLIKLSNDCAFKNSIVGYSPMDYIDQHEDAKKQFEDYLNELETIYKTAKQMSMLTHSSSDTTKKYIGTQPPAIQERKIVITSITDVIRATIQPLIEKYNDHSVGGNITYRKVYAAMGVSWLNRKTRYKNEHGLKNPPRKITLIEQDRKLLKLFVDTVDRLLSCDTIREDC